VVCDSGGYIVTGSDLRKGDKPPESWVLDRKPYAMEPSLAGVFAAGDVRAGSIKRGASAVGEGARTVASVHRHLVIATWRMADRTIRSEGEAKNGIRALP